MKIILWSNLFWIKDNNLDLSELIDGYNGNDFIRISIPDNIEDIDKYLKELYGDEID